MQNYIAIIHKEKGSSYGVHFPDIPGCYSAGDTLDLAIANAAQALAFYFEDMPFIKARPMEDIRQEATQDLKEGALLVAIPYIDFAGRSVRANITMDAGLLKGIDETAKKRGLTRSAFLAQVATKEVYGNNL
ncbi:MAG: type II toxin-antitoxin system HicB family antitoxin [Robiginitomaculum sp.]|nr:type II toxin-antitoxin system HicB family antitoxin [Robiginitomaculum sp.]